MMTRASSRRSFLKGTGTALFATGAASGLALASKSAPAAQREAMTQTKETQAAITPDKALRMLKDGNARFVQGQMLARDYVQQVKATGDGQFPFAAIVGCIDSRAPNELTFDQVV